MGSRPKNPRRSKGRFPTGLFRLLRSLLLIVPFFVFSGCGGGGASSSLAGGGIGGSGIQSVGPITDFGSVFVNGVEYDTTWANILMNGVPNRPISALKVGMVVRVSGTIDPIEAKGTATVVDYESELTGTIGAPPVISTTGGTFVIFGQTVVVDAGTVFDNASGIEALSAGTLVEVSGFRDRAGQIHATFVAADSAAPSVIQIKGTISEVTPTTFRLGSLVVNYGGATTENVPPGGLGNGLLVAVRSGSLPVNGVLTASDIEVEKGVPATHGQAALQGYVANLSGNSFTLNGQAVAVNAQTAYKNGTAASLANNVKVEVEGELVAGVLVASRLEFDQAPTVRLQTQVSAVNVAARMVTVFGSPGVVVQFTDQTLLLDQSSARLRAFGLANIAPGDRLAIVGVNTGQSSVNAKRVVRTDPDAQALLEGPLESAVLPTLTILGVNANTSVATQFQDSNGNAVSQSVFFDQTTPGRIVQVQGLFDGTAIAVTKASFRN